MHANPSLSAVGTGTMVADGLHLVNDEVSSTSFRVSRVAIGPQNFLGNDVTYPAGGRTGDNVLLGTKVLVPLDGEIREGVGLLGAPCFEIPRSVERDMRFDHLRTGEALRRGLAAKNRRDLKTMGVRVGRRVFDDGAHISEPTLTAIGDESVLNYRSKIQCHSQEDGTFKCDRTTVGAGCTIGVGAFVLYGVTMGDGSILAADSFLMKGEYVPARACWGGNPAREM